jgi:hypothetical protein
MPPRIRELIVETETELLDQTQTGTLRRSKADPLLRTSLIIAMLLLHAA